MKEFLHNAWEVLKYILIACAFSAIGFIVNFGPDWLTIVFLIWIVGGAFVFAYLDAYLPAKRKKQNKSLL